MRHTAQRHSYSRHHAARLQLRRCGRARLCTTKITNQRVCVCRESVCSWRLALLAWLVAPLVAVVNRVYGDFVQRNSRKTQTAIAGA